MNFSVEMAIGTKPQTDRKDLLRKTDFNIPYFNNSHFAFLPEEANIKCY